MAEQRKFVGIYDRPHALRRRQVWVPLAVAIVAAIGWLVFFVFW